eukprot:SAG11_NODE_5960_length_1424_cov_3.063396_1_plen_78_part_10
MRVPELSEWSSRTYATDSFRVASTWLTSQFLFRVLFIFVLSVAKFWVGLRATPAPRAAARVAERRRLLGELAALLRRE